MKKRKDDITDSGRKKKGIFGMELAAIAVMSITIFVSCGYQSYGANGGQVTGQAAEQTTEQAAERTWADEKQENENLTPKDTEENAAETEDAYISFDYNHEYNKLIRCYGDNVYLEAADGIYCIKNDGAKERIYENSYQYQRGMEIYQNFLYFCGSAQRGEDEAATIYRMNLDTQEVEDALAVFSQVFDVLYHISIYEDKLYVASGLEAKRIGFALSRNGQIIRQLDEKGEDFLYKQYNECMDLDWRRMQVPYDSEEYWNLAEESKKRYYPVMDVAACKKLLRGKQVVSRYKDELYRSIYLENENGAYEFLCDAAYYLSPIITDTGVYYVSNERGDIGYVDYVTKTPQLFYAVEETEEVTPVNYDADYIYLIQSCDVGLDANSDWIEETYLLRIPRQGGEAETVYQFEGDLQEYGSLARCAVYDGYLFFELHDPISLEVDAARTYDPEDYGRIVEIREEFTNENTEEITFYYEMENFYVNEAFENGDKINDTLQKIYDENEQGYKKYRLTFVGEQYISMVYNDIAYMGGAHPYSYFDGITIDCKTGEEVSASELLGKSDEDILKQVSEEMGMDMVAYWDAIDFYLTDSKIVFFYRMPNYWDDVVWERRLHGGANQ